MEGRDNREMTWRSEDSILIFTFFKTVEQVSDEGRALLILRWLSLEKGEINYPVR